MVASRTTGWLGALGAVAALLLTGGCGCTEDSFTPTGESFPFDSSARAQIGMEIPAVEVPVKDEVPVRVDVMFLLDDSFFITQRTTTPTQTVPLGAILGEGVTPPRIKTDVAQAVFQNSVDDLLARIIADHGGVAEDYDLAFGVSRFEDYADFQRSGPKSSNPADVAQPVDRLARPFILNQPLLRQGNQLFNSLFGQSLEREAPGDGGKDPQDGQAALEALYQLATGAGFDGDDDGSTTGSGPAGALATQTNPGVSGDVPAPAFGTEGEDDDGEPEYTIGDTIASGNIGGAGWRPDSIRFVVVFSDICTITMLEEDLDPEGPISNTANASDVPGEPGAGPRGEEAVTSVQAFACTTGEQALDPSWSGPTDPVSQQAYARFGPVDGAIPVAPIGTNPQAKAAMLQQTVDALNEMNIEVLSIGIRQQIDPGPNKPNVPGPTFPNAGEVAAIPDPSVPPNDDSPFTWMSAMAILTGARDTDLTDPDPRWIPDLPLVYNLTSLNPADGPITDGLVEDLSDRVGAWLPYVDRGGAGTTGDPGWAYYTVVLDSPPLSNPELSFDPVPFRLVPDSDPDGQYVSGGPVPTVQTVRVRCYWQGTTAPAPLRVAWQFGVTRTNEGATPQLIAVSPYNFTTTLTPAATVPGGKNPTAGHEPADVPIPGAVSGTLTAVYPEIAAGQTPESVPDAPTTLTSVTSGEAFFRDLVRGIPLGTTLETMFGPIGPADAPYPTP